MKQLLLLVLMASAVFVNAAGCSRGGNTVEFPENPDPAVRLRCVRLSRAAHAAASLSHTDQRILDEEVARLFGLTPKELSALRRFDSRLTTPAHR